ncbi:MAG TPA: hypothetical protein VMW12_03465 [Candidatus Dormibacteraeota bacterium]|nr:hypothetical protein [Candidatus Dormibacteraeota bacterium]
MTALRRIYVAACAVVATGWLTYVIARFAVGTSAFWPPTDLASAACLVVGIVALVPLVFMAIALLVSMASSSTWR